MEIAENGRFYEPIKLPGPRQTPRDDHHLLWEKDYLIDLGFRQLRELPCAIAVQMDSRVHSVIHILWSGFVKFSNRNRTQLAELTGRAASLIDIHDRLQCSCFNPSRKVIMSTLTLKEYSHGEYAGPACTALLVDKGVHRLMRDYYQRRVATTNTLRQLLVDRCDEGDCTCWKPTRKGPVRYYPSWHYQSNIQ